MADTTNPDWMNQWQALARQYASNWQNASSGAAAMPTPAGPAPGFEQWSRLFAPGAGSQGETIERLVDSTKNYVAGMQSMFAAATANAQGGNAPWGNAFAQGFANPGASAPLFEHPAARAWRQMAAQGGDGFASFAGALQAPPPADLGELKAWLKLPTFGSSREQQEHYQKTAIAAVEYQEQMNRYNALMLRASQRGFELFESKLAEREQPGRQIESLRALYDLWVDAAEEGYAEVALSIEFREVYGALVNAQMRVRALLQHEVERIGTELGMPTRSEVNSIGERLQALRREVRAHGGDALAGEIAALREELATLKGNAKHAQWSTEAVERKPATAPRKAAAAGKRSAALSAARTRPHAVGHARGSRKASASAKLPVTKMVRVAPGQKASTSPSSAKTVVAKKAVPKKAVPKKAVPKKAERATGAKKTARRASAVSKKVVPATPVSGARSFASRIAKFANASLGTSRARAHRAKKRTKSRSAKTR